MQYDYKKLADRITNMFITQKAFATEMGLSEQTVSQRMNNITEWPQRDILKAVDVLKFPNGKNDIPQYFFAVKVK